MKEAFLNYQITIPTQFDIFIKYGPQKAVKSFNSCRCFYRAYWTPVCNFQPDDQQRATYKGHMQIRHFESDVTVDNDFA